MMRALGWLRVLLVILSGCAGELPTPVEDARAVEVLWRAVGNRFPMQEAPPVHVHWTKDLCVPAGNGKCHAGMAVGQDIWVVWTGRHSIGAFAHEVTHAWQWVARGGPGLPNHETFDWEAEWIGQATLYSAGL